MAQTPEGRVKAKIKAWLNTLPQCWFFMPVASGMGKGGVPDIIVCLGGKFLAIEVKAPGCVRNTTALQDMQIAAINNAGGVSFATDSLADCQSRLRLLGYV